jgi:uncharacterized membrane protein
VDYVIVKWLHVLSSTVLFGTGIGSAYYMLRASLTREPRTVLHVVSHVVFADWIFTTTTIILQPLTGFYLVWRTGIDLSASWLVWSIVLYFVAGACWLPVVWMQIRMRAMAREAVAKETGLPSRYFRWLRIWVALGVPAFVALVGVFYLKVAKPV